MNTLVRRSRPAGLVLAALAVAALAGCHSAAPSAGASPKATSMTDQQILGIGRQYAQCVRDHGVANFPDMIVVAGQLTLPDDASGDAGDAALRANPAARDACASILQQLPASAQKNTVPSAEDRQKLLQYAQCMRDHGVPEWPDPAADGSFPIANTALGAEGKSARILAASEACKKYWDKGISVK
jgi:hypothetical protein